MNVLILWYIAAIIMGFGLWILFSLRRKDSEFFKRIERRNSAMMDEDDWPDDDTTYSMEEVMARMEKTMRIGKKYYGQNYRRGGMFRYDHPISKRRGQKFLDELSPGISGMINNKIERRKEAVVEREPFRGSRYRTGRKYRRYFGNNR